MNTEKITLTYFYCNRVEIISAIIILPCLIVFFSFIQLLVFSEIANIHDICLPVYFFWGNKKQCSKYIKEQVEIIRLQKRDLTNSASDSNTVPKESFTQGMTEKENKNYDIRNFFRDLKEFIQINYLAMMNFINSIDILIYVCLDNIISKYIK